jgi:dihydropteroate synthase
MVETAAVAGVWEGAKFHFDLSKATVLMGILNVTPDSFSDGGRFGERDKARKRAWEIAEEGADILDIGGESSRPGSEPVPLSEELSRTIPLITALIEEDYPIPISIDTSKSQVAEEALKIGAAVVNDISALSVSDDMGPLVAAHNAGIVLMHMRGTPRNMQKNTSYEDILGEIGNFLSERAALCVKAGVQPGSIALDPGIGFGKSVQGNLEVTARLDEIEALGFPVLYGSSRKSFIGKTLGLEVDNRLEGTAATVCAAILCGADIIRVHDVREMARVAKMTDAILNSFPENPESKR